MPKKLDITIPWYPQPKQAQLLEACGLMDCILGGHPKPPVARYIGYGGAAYGGKTDGDLGVAITAAFAFPGCNIGFFRRTFPELNMVGGAIKRSLEILPGIASFNVAEHTWLFPSGSRLQFCYAQNENDVLKYKSSQFDILIMDEATTFTWFMVDCLFTRNRATVDGITAFALLTTNPGDVGHTWYMTLFDTLNTLGRHNTVKDVENPNGKKSQIYFIPAFIADNEIGLVRDPEYGDRLAERDPLVARALLRGDWTIFAGQAFPQWRYDRHTCDWFDIPLSWPRWRALDYGWDHPTYCHWFAKDPELSRKYIYREWHGRQMTDAQIAQAIKDSTLPGERINFTFASPDMWRAQRADKIVTSAPETFAKYGVIITQADNDRLNGKRKFNQALGLLPDGLPAMLVFREQCPDLIKLMPTLVKSKLNPEDVEKVDGDDPYDSARYGFTNEDNAPVGRRTIKQSRSPLLELVNGR